MSTLALCPSRGRPAQAAECLRSFLETRRDPDSRIVFVVDDDDPTALEYPPGYTRLQPAGGGMGAALRAATVPEVLQQATSVGMIGDDNRFRTPGWDRIIDGWLTERPGIAYGDDGLQHERLPTSWWVSRPIVDVFGMIDPGFRHLYMDNYWKALGEAAGCLRYFPEVSIEHLHPLAGKAPDDATYRRGNSSANATHDRGWYRTWFHRRRLKDAERLRQVLRAATEGPRRVLADWHHPALWEALTILLEDRYGWQLYSPMGFEWLEHGWTFNGGGTSWRAARYLEFPEAVLEGDHYTLAEAEYPARRRKLVTWQQANSQPWDHVLSSVSEHQRPFGALAKAWGARALHQVGNARHAIDWRLPQLILASAAVQPRRNVLRWHQEFDLGMFGYAEPTHPLNVTSFMLRLESTSCDYAWMASAPGLKWRAMGGTAPGTPGYLAPMSKVASAMAATGWVWHDKRIGDGYGHVLYNAASMGRPLIGHASHYQGLLGAPLWRDLDTCIDLDRHSEADAVRLIRAVAADPEWYRELTERTAETFLQLVDFDREAAVIREALSR